MKRKAPFSFVPLPAGRSLRKPRRSGRTMVIDDGLPFAYARDIGGLGGAYIDLAKIKTGTARLYPRAELMKKLRLYKRNQIQPFLGGQFHEYVFATQGEKAPGQTEDVKQERRVKYMVDAVRSLPRRLPVNVMLFPMDGDPYAAGYFWELAVASGGSLLTPSQDWP